MSRTEQVILTNMCMITDGQQVLVQDRNSKKWPGVTFPGGGGLCHNNDRCLKRCQIKDLSVLQSVIKEEKFIFYL